MSVVDELVTLLGLKVDPKAQGEAEGFGKVLGGVTKAAVALGATLAAVAGAVGAYTIKQAESVDAAGKFADSLGISYESLQKLEYAAQRAGGSGDELRGDLEKLTKTMSSPVPGEFNQTLYQLGVSARNSKGELKSADDLLLEIAGTMESMSKQRQQQFAEKLGISPGTLKLMQQGKGGIQDLQEEAVRLGLVLEENSKDKAARFQDSLLNARSVVDALGKSIAVGLMPAMADSFDLFTDWVGANREFIALAVTQIVEGAAMGFQLFGDAVSWAWDQVSGLLGPLEGLSGDLDITQAVALAVAAALGAVAVATLAATWPVLAIGAAIVALVVIFEDLYAAIQGQDSIIGGWINSFTSAYPEISGVLSSIFEWLGKIAGFFADVLTNSVTNWGGAIIDVISTVIGGVGDMLTAIESILSGADPFKVLGDLFSKQVDRIFGLASSLGTRISDTIGGIFSFGSSPQAANVPAGVMQGGGGGSTVNNNVTNNINGAGNPGAVAQEIGNRGGFGQTLQKNQPGFNGPIVG